MTSSLEDGDPLQEARAYNTSILFMVSVPYVLFGGVGLLIFWKLRHGVRPVADETAV